MNINVYENIVIFNASLSDEEIEAATQKIKDLITGNQGEILKVEPWGRKKLTYELNKQTKGFFTLFLFRAPSSVVKPLEELYKVYDPVFKYMVVRLEKKQTEAALRALAQEETAAAAEASAPAQETPAETATTEKAEENV